MTKEDWEIFERKLSVPYGHRVDLLADGYKISVIVVQTSPMRFGLELYVNNDFQLKWLTEDCEIRRRFCRKCTKKLYSTAKIKEIRKECGKRFADQCAAQKYEYYVPTWNSPRSLKAHLIKHNQSIEFYHPDPGGETDANSRNHE